jgi:hypothetical protein
MPAVFAVFAIGFVLLPNLAKAAGMMDCLMDRSDCRDLIGKRLWVVVPKSNPNSVEISQPAYWLRRRYVRYLMPEKPRSDFRLVLARY